MSAEPRTPPPAGPLSLLALVVALAMCAGSAYLSLGMGLIPCPLCYYQRTFAFAVLGVLAIGVFTGAGRATSLGTLALPLAIAGQTVAAWHVGLERSGKMECPLGIAELGSAPLQSLVAFSLLVLVLLSESWQDLRPGGGWSAIVTAAVIGGVLGSVCILSARPIPTKYDYDAPITICRPPRP